MKVAKSVGNHNIFYGQQEKQVGKDKQNIMAIEYSHLNRATLGPVIFRFKKSNFPFQKKLNSVSIPFHYWQR